MKTKVYFGRRHGLDVYWPVVFLPDGTAVRSEFFSEFGARLWIARQLLKLRS